MILEVLEGESPVLQRPSSRVAGVDTEVRKLAADLLDTLHDCHFASLSAPQCGKPVRMFVTEIMGQSRVWVNPELLETRGEQDSVESCASFPDLTLELRRPQTIVVRSISLDGTSAIHTLTGVEARLVAHELDHLNGVLFQDHLDSLDLFEQILGSTEEFPETSLSQESTYASEQTEAATLFDNEAFTVLDEELRQVLDLLADGAWKVTLATELLKDFDLDDDLLEQLTVLEHLSDDVSEALDFWESLLLGELLGPEEPTEEPTEEARD